MIDAEEDEDAEETNAKPTKKPKAAAAAKKNEKKEIPDGKPNALKGLRLLFTGTFDSMDRSTCEAAAVHYGASITKKLVDTDYVVLGVRAGQKKLDEIAEKDLDTITESDFFQLLKTGVSDDKRRKMRAKAAAEEPAKKKAKK
nr:replication factor c subunit 1 [Quercus suber]